MAKNTLRALEDKLARITSGGAQELNELQAKLDVTRETERAAAEAAKNAQNEGDPEAYGKALAEQRAAGEIAQMYVRKMKAIEVKPIIGKEEYLDLKQQIMDSLDEVIMNSYQRLIPILAELEVVKDDLARELILGNEMLEKVQRDLYKEPKVREYMTEDGRKGTVVGASDTYRSEGPMGILNHILGSTEVIKLRAKGE